MVKQFVGGWADGEWLEIGQLTEGVCLAKVVTSDREIEYYRYNGRKFVFDVSVEAEWKANGWN